MTNNAHDFQVGDVVQYTPRSKELLGGFDDNQRFDQTFIIKGVRLVPRADYDPFSPNYMGECAGREAVGHHQLVTLEGYDSEVSGSHLQPAWYTRQPHKEVLATHTSGAFFFYYKLTNLKEIQIFHFNQRGS
jgi:hypothetical protein